MLPVAGPLVLAGLLYLGGGIAVAAYGLLSRRGGFEAKLTRRDGPWMLGVVALGGVAGPVLMLIGLERVSGLSGSLLLTLEGPLTVWVAVVFFREHLSTREKLATAVIFAAATVLAVRPGELGADLLGMAALVAACACWAWDNNFTQRLSLKDPIAVVRVKALGAGGCMLAVALLLGRQMPDVRTCGLALLLGGFSYGASILLDTYALRLLGAAREAAYFATAPFIGAMAAVPLLHERPRASDAVAFAVMATGVILLVRARHGHLHSHEPLEHEHLHVHDEHHQHAHDSSVTEPHSHPHRHASLTHDHPHVSDLHHRHKH